MVCLRDLTFAANFEDFYPGYFQVRYEDMVGGELTALEEYLGLKLERDTTVSAEFARVARTKSCGDWKNWFTAEDVMVFRQALGSYCARYGYEDWEPNAEQVIDPAHSSQYVERIVLERRRAE